MKKIMWRIKRLALSAQTLDGAGPRLSAARLAQHLDAQDILAQARRQAGDIIRQARLEADSLLAQALSRAREQSRACLALEQQQFARQAQALFLDWQRQRQEWRETLLPRAELLLNQAMAQLAGALPQEERLRAILHQLLLAQGEMEPATLWCHPDRQAQVAGWLAERPHIRWRLKTHARQGLLSVLLTTEHGELSLDWEQMIAQLPSGDEPDPSPLPTL